jgi:hypothetical protein
MKGISEIADAVELRAWASGKASTFNSIKEELQAAMADDEEEAPEDCAQGVMDEIQSRKLLLNGAYPFTCDGYRLSFTPPAAGASTYLFCLGLSLLPPAQISNEQRSIQFETVAMSAAKSFFGGTELRIGAPWRTDEIPTYEDLLKKVAALIPNLGPLTRDAAPEGGDCGWDVLIVKGFKDQEFPRLIVLGNCATGRTDWLRKGMEAAPRYFFDSSFTSDHKSVLITFFAVPFVMDEEARKRKLYGQTITFDRFRICEHAPLSPPEVADWLETTRGAALEVTLN